MNEDDSPDDRIENEPTTLQRFQVIVSPETERGTRTVTIRQGRQTDAEGPMVLERDQRAEASVEVQAEERSDGASVQVATDLLSETLIPDGSGWATIPDDLPDDFDQRGFSGAPDSALAWLSNQPKKNDVVTAALDEAGASDPYADPTKTDWGRIYLELRRRRLAIEKLEAALDDVVSALNGMPGRPDAKRNRSDALDDVDSLGLDLDGHTDARGKEL